MLKYNSLLYSSLNWRTQGPQQLVQYCWPQSPGEWSSQSTSGSPHSGRSFLYYSYKQNMTLNVRFFLFCQAWYTVQTTLGGGSCKHLRICAFENEHAVWCFRFGDSWLFTSILIIIIIVVISIVRVTGLHILETDCDGLNQENNTNISVFVSNSLKSYI